jgi:hypothetical protein
MDASAFIGYWKITHMDVWAQDYVDLVVPGFIELTHEDHLLIGTFQFGTVSGRLDCRLRVVSVARITILAKYMKTIVCILALVFGCLIPSDVRGADKPIRLALEQTTTLHVGELALLHIPSDRRYLRPKRPNGAWSDVLALVRRSRRDVTFRAVRPGKGVIILSPDVPNGECISCATIHYFIEVVSQK